MFGQLELGGGGQGGPGVAAAHPRAPRLAGAGRALDAPARRLRQAQAHQQPARRQRTREYYYAS